MIKLLILYITIIFITCCNASQYCATVSADQAGDAFGYFAMNVVDGVGYYYFDLNLDNFDPTDLSGCDLSTDGLKYHIHSYWTNSSVTSSAGGTFCGASYTGGHYDPNFACSTASQNYTSACTDIGRIPAAGYTYTCTAELYSAGDYASCEIGDLSGKFNNIYASDDSLQFTTSAPLVDTNPPYETSFEANEKNSLKWSSIVFHCGNSAAPRLVCAEFSSLELNSCAEAFVKIDSLIYADVTGDDESGDDALTYNDYSGAIAVSVVVSIIVGIVIGIGAMRFYYGKKSADSLLNK